jgi:hypothetical protein
MVVDYYATDKTPLLDRVKRLAVALRNCVTMVRYTVTVKEPAQGSPS